MFARSTFLAAALGGVIVAAGAQTAPPGGKSIVAVGPNVLGQAAAAFGDAQLVPVSGQPFKQALRVRTLKRPTNDWEFQLHAWTTAPVAVGEVLLASYTIRATKGQPETGEARVQFGFATTGPEWAPSIGRATPAGRNWKRYDIPFVVKHARPAGQSHATLTLGYDPQTIEVGGFTLVSYGVGYDVDRLPRTRATWAGEEPGAAWRKAANARIEKIRKGPLSLKVVDARGRPVRNGQVSVQLERHGFYFGTAAAADQLLAKGPDADRYREILRKHFNHVTIENHLKWPFYETWGKKDGLAALDWLNANGFPVRGHVMVWPGWRNLPNNLRDLQGDKAALRARIDARIRDITAATKGKIFEWDVVNETYDNHDLMDILGWQEVGRWFRLAKQGDPKPRLTLNDYPQVDGSDPNNRHLNHLYETALGLKKEGVPIEAIGVQCHLGSSTIAPVHVLSGLDKLAKVGLPIVVTELDLDTADEDAQARYLRDYLITLFSHPSVAGITQWGFWEGRHWFKDAALWRKDWRIKPSGQAYVDLLTKTWTTRAAGKTDRQGRYATRGFYGTYKVTVRQGGKAVTKVVELKKGSAGPVVVRL